MKKLIALMLCLATLLSLSIPASAAGYSTQYTEEAQTLYELGLFKGTGTNADGTPVFALDRQATRIEGLVMLIRLLGEEEDALAFAGECPFVDVPSWAEKYAGYAYEMRYTKGTSATTFSDGPLYSNAFLTFVLRSLGYDDAAGDFSYSTATQKAAEIGIIAAGSYADQSNAIYRDDCAKISFNALKTTLKDAETTLLDKLVADGVLTDDMVQESGVLSEKVTIPMVGEFTESGKFKGVIKHFSDTILSEFPNAAYVVFNAAMTPLSNMEKLNFTAFNIALSSTSEKGVYGNKLHNGCMDLSTYGAHSYNYGGGDSLITVSIFDKDDTLIAYCNTHSKWIQKIDTGSDLYNMNLTFTTCDYKYSEYKEDLNKLDDAIEKIVTVDEGAIYLEEIITVQADGTETKERYLRIHEDKWPSNLEKPAYYSIVSGGMKNRARILRDYATLFTDVKSFNMNHAGSDSVYNGIKIKSILSWDLILYNENRDIICCAKYTNADDIQTRIEE